MNVDRPSRSVFHLPFMSRNNSSKDGQSGARHMPIFGLLPDKYRNHLVAMLGEFMGTFLFLLFALAGTTVAVRAKKSQVDVKQQTTDDSTSMLSSQPDASTLMYIALSFGFSLAVNAWVFFRISGGLFNPAVTLGMALIGAIGWLRACIVFIAQMTGGICAAAVVSALYPGPLDVGTRLSAHTSVARGLFIEMFLTCGLCFTIFLLAVEKHKSTFLAPVGIGLALFIGQLAGVFFSGGSLNPTRSFSVDVANASFPHYHWIYWLGPGLGACLAVLVYRLVKALEYETANPCQDCDSNEVQQQEGKEAIWIPTTSDSETGTQAFQDGPHAEEANIRRV